MNKDPGDNLPPCSLKGTMTTTEGGAPGRAVHYKIAQNSFLENWSSSQEIWDGFFSKSQKSEESCLLQFPTHLKAEHRSSGDHSCMVVLGWYSFIKEVLARVKSGDDSGGGTFQKVLDGFIVFGAGYLI